MKKVIILFISLCILVFASVKPGENILTNGRFAGVDESGTPNFWFKRIGEEYIHHFADGGPDNLPYIRFQSPENGTASGQTSLRQYGLTLKEGETYTISAWVRTRNFSATDVGVGLINFDWYGSLALAPGSANQEWRLMNATFTMIPSKSGTYVGIIYAMNFTGTLDVADFRIEAVSEGALANSEIAASVQLLRRPRLVAISPIMHRIPTPETAIDFQFYGELPDGTYEDYDIVLQVENGGERREVLQAGENFVSLPSGAQSGDLWVKLIHRASGKSVFADRLEFTVVPKTEIDTSEHRRLNNFVTELLCRRISGSAKEESFIFHAPRDGWVFIALERGGATVRLDDSLRVIKPDTPRNETFRRVAAGRHKLSVSGAPEGASLVVRSIPEIFDYCPGVNSPVTENPSYDWEFQEKYVLPAVTTYDGGQLSPQEFAQLHERGYSWVGNLGSRALESDSDLASRLEQSEYTSSDRYDGVACDEQYMIETEIIERYGNGIKLYRNNNNKKLYSWSTGLPSTSVDASYISACVNASRGNGLLLLECYLPPQPGRREAEEHFCKKVIDLIGRYRKLYPDADRSLGIILGADTQLPILSLNTVAQADFKAHFDLIVRLLATSPECANIPCTGCWGSYYAEEEHHRWIFKVFRHYCIEGKTDSLAEEFGYDYLPGIIENGNFDSCLDGWSASGEIACERIPSFGSANLGMLDSGSTNEHLAVFAKGEAGAESRLVQTIRNLVPGKSYCLQFVTCDVNDVKAHRLNPRRFGINATLQKDCAELQEELSWVFVDKRVNGRFAEMNNVGRINLHHYVFTAKSDSMILTFDNGEAAPGEVLGIAFVTVNPYFAREE